MKISLCYKSPSKVYVCKISVQSVQRFLRDWGTDRQTDRQTPSQFYNNIDEAEQSTLRLVGTFLKLENLFNY